ncbi:MAG TPA: phospholipase D-like domain-containing protein, partial [Candidatus Elarobacter sp.]|nr:phospholipase D-like domain-containing protein [Candidatus Elarobacter sp.]
VAATARDRLWLTDAYFAGTPQHVESLRAAARDGVDVRLLVPGASDISILRPLSQSGYRPLLEAGVRVFEWNGPMIHAKTAVADGRWARVGSSNLNIASWLGNYELDAVIEDAKFASAMEEMYRADLERATEVIVRRERRRQVASDTAASSARAARKRGRHRRGNVRKNMGTATAGAMRLGRTVGAAVTGRRVLAPTEAWILVCAGLSLLLLGAAAVRWPRIAVIPLAVIMAWCAIGLIAQGAELYRSRTSSIGAARSRTSPLER